MSMSSIQAALFGLSLLLLDGCAGPSDLRTRPLSDFNGRIDMDGREAPAMVFLVAGTDPNDAIIRPVLLVERYESLGEDLVDFTNSTGYVRAPLRLVVAGGTLTGTVATELSVLREVQHDTGGPVRTTDMAVTVDADGMFEMAGTTGSLPGDVAFSALGEVRTACAMWASNAVQLEASLRAGEVELPIENGTLVVHCDGSGFELR